MATTRQNHATLMEYCGLVGRTPTAAQICKALDLMRKGLTPAEALSHALVFTHS